MIYTRGAALKEVQRILQKGPSLVADSWFIENIAGCNQNVTELIRNNKCYTLWAAELFKAGRKIEDEIDTLLESTHKEKTGLFQSCQKLRNNLNQAFSQLKGLQDFETDVREFQNFVLASNFPQKGTTIETLFDLARQLSDKLFLCFNLINSKLKEITAARITAGNLTLTIFFLIITLLNFLLLWCYPHK